MGVMMLSVRGCPRGRPFLVVVGGFLFGGFIRLSKGVLYHRPRDARTATFDAWGGYSRATYRPRYDVKRPCPSIS